MIRVALTFLGYIPHISRMPKNILVKPNRKRPHGFRISELLIFLSIIYLHFNAVVFAFMEDESCQIKGPNNATIIVLDCSGSMNQRAPNQKESRWEYAKNECKKFIKSLPVDGSSTIILIPFANQVGFPNEKPLPIPPFSEFTFTDAKQVTDVIALIDRLPTEGSTDLWEAVLQGIACARDVSKKSPIINFIIATDGDDNLGTGKKFTYENTTLAVQNLSDELGRTGGQARIVQLAEGLTNNFGLQPTSALNPSIRMSAVESLLPKLSSKGVPFQICLQREALSGDIPANQMATVTFISDSVDGRRLNVYLEPSQIPIKSGPIQLIAKIAPAEEVLAQAGLKGTLKIQFPANFTNAVQDKQRLQFRAEDRISIGSIVPNQGVFAKDTSIPLRLTRVEPGVEVKWKFTSPSGKVSAQKSIEAKLQFTESGPWTVTATATAAGKKDAQETARFTCEEVGLTVKLADNQKLVMGQPITFIATTKGVVKDLSWTQDGAIVSKFQQNENDVKIIFDKPGNHEVKAFGTSPLVANVQAAAVTIKVEAGVAVMLTLPINEVDAGVSTKFRAVVNTLDTNGIKGVEFQIRQTVSSNWIVLKDMAGQKTFSLNPLLGQNGVLQQLEATPNLIIPQELRGNVEIEVKVITDEKRQIVLGSPSTDKRLVVVNPPGLRIEEMEPAKNHLFISGETVRFNLLISGSAVAAIQSVRWELFEDGKSISKFNSPVQVANGKAKAAYEILLVDAMVGKELRIAANPIDSKGDVVLNDKTPLIEEWAQKVILKEITYAIAGMPNSEVLMAHDVVLRIAPAAGIKNVEWRIDPQNGSIQGKPLTQHEATFQFDSHTGPRSISATVFTIDGNKREVPAVIITIAKPIFELAFDNPPPSQAAGKKALLRFKANGVENISATIKFPSGKISEIKIGPGKIQLEFDLPEGETGLVLVTLTGDTAPSGPDQARNPVSTEHKFRSEVPKLGKPTIKIDNPNQRGNCTFQAECICENMFGEPTFYYREKVSEEAPPTKSDILTGPTNFLLTKGYTKLDNNHTLTRTAENLNGRDAVEIDIVVIVEGDELNPLDKSHIRDLDRITIVHNMPPDWSDFFINSGISVVIGGILWQLLRKNDPLNWTYFADFGDHTPEQYPPEYLDNNEQRWAISNGGFGFKGGEPERPSWLFGPLCVNKSMRLDVKWLLREIKRSSKFNTRGEDQDKLLERALSDLTGSDYEIVISCESKDLLHYAPEVNAASFGPGAKLDNSTKRWPAFAQATVIEDCYLYPIILTESEEGVLFILIKRLTGISFYTVAICNLFSYIAPIAALVYPIFWIFKFYLI